MFERIKNCICHPRLLGLYYKDSFFKVIGALVSVFLIFMVLSVTIAVNTKHFDYNDTKTVTNMIMHKDSSDISYDSRTASFSGTPIKMESENYILDFLTNENYSKSNKMVFRFNAKSMDFIYEGFVVATCNYADYETEDFSLLMVQKGDISNMMNFQKLLHELFDDINKSFSAVVIASDSAICLGYYLVVLLIAIVASYFTNPDIQGKVRVKLCLYSTLIYFVVMIFALLYDAKWLQYVALCLPILFTNMTFSRIIRVNKKIN